MGALISAHILGTIVPVEEPSTASKPDSCTAIILFNHVVGLGEQRRRHREAEYLGGLKVDRQLKFCRRLHREISRFLALEDAVDISRRSAPLIDLIGTIGNQTAVGRKIPVRIDRRQTMTVCERNDRTTTRNCVWMRENQ